MTAKRGIEAPNYTAVPNRLFQIFPLMRESELRVTLVIARETFGWRRDRKRLSVNLLMKLTGLSRQGVLSGTEAGLKRGTIERYAIKDHRNRDTFEYELIVLADDASCPESDRSTKLTGQPNGPVNEVDQSPVNEVDRTGGLLVHEVDPLKERTTKEKPRKEKREAPAVPARRATPDQVASQNIPVTAQEASGTSAPVQTPAATAAPAHAGSQGQQNPSQDQPSTQGRQNGSAVSTEQVPGAAAGRGAASTEAYLRRKLSSRFVDQVLDELQPLGVERRRDWFALPLERAEQLVAEAQATHTAHGMKVPTRLRDLLDDECRRVNIPLRPAAPTTDDGEIDMDALMASAPLNGTARRNR